MSKTSFFIWKGTNSDGEWLSTAKLNWDPCIIVSRWASLGSKFSKHGAQKEKLLSREHAHKSQPWAALREGSQARSWWQASPSGSPSQSRPGSTQGTWLPFCGPLKAMLWWSYKSWPLNLSVDLDWLVLAVPPYNFYPAFLMMSGFVWIVCFIDSGLTFAAVFKVFCCHKQEL